MVDKASERPACKQYKPIQQKKYNIAVVDDFKTKDVCIDFDFSPDESHGNVVKRFIKEKLPTANVEEFQIAKNNGATYSPALDSILENVKGGHKYDAINLSMSAVVDFDFISAKVGKKITAQNIYQNMASIKKWMSHEKNDMAVVQLQEIVDTLDQLSASGVKVYVAAGNEGKDKFNMLTLVKGAKVVGALDSKSNKTKFSEDNSIVNSWDKGIFTVHRVKDAKGRLGFDYTGDGSIDIYANKTTAWFKFGSFTDLKGTSLACPKKLAEDLKKNKK